MNPLLTEHRFKKINYISTYNNEPERAILVGVVLPHQQEWEVNESIEELKQLTYSAGAEPVFTIIQKRQKLTPATFIGKGKAEEIRELVKELNANIVIFDDDLTPAQQRNLEEIIGVKTIDRTELILDIFAQRAHTKAGQLQVELAQLKYRLTRLTGKGILLSRLGGGIGTRGPGETKLEVDRRRIRARINHLEKAIEELSADRALQRSLRKNRQIPVVAIIGYTNAGKSTLLNSLCKANVVVEDKLFATLDPTTRRLHLPNGQMILLTDTVGFIRKLPHHLVAAFRATLEEVRQADLLLHVVDISHPNYEQQIEAVYDVLKELEADNKPLLTVWNKIDMFPENSLNAIKERLTKKVTPSVIISALTGFGINELLEALEKEFKERWKKYTFSFPLDRQDLVSELYSIGRVSFVAYENQMIKVEAELLDTLAGKFIPFLYNGENE